MHFSDLLLMQFDARTQIIDADRLKTLLPETPDDVLQQVYRDHGRNSFFQEQYGRIRIDRITWEKREFQARELVDCSYNLSFKNYFEGRRDWAKNFSREGWSCVDCRKDVIEYWEANRTWQRAPVLIEAALVLGRSGLFIMEGHSRISILMGLVAEGVVAPESTHVAWLGSVR